MPEIPERSVFICPVCKGSLARSGGALLCEKGHSFDLSAQGYVNLCPTDKSRGNAGDSAQMMAARSRFLNSGAYDCLKDAVSDAVLRCVRGAQSPAVVADAGCGEGYYTSGMAAALQSAGVRARVAGIDLSKRGVRAAAKRGGAQYAVAGIFDMPFANAGIDVVTSLFAPLCDSEFLRVLRSDGMLIVVTPGREHLFGLKKVLYDSPYENPEEPYCPEGFKAAGRRRVRTEISVEGGLVADLFAMTPYYWNTPDAGVKRLEAVRRLETPVDFLITTLQKLP